MNNMHSAILVISIAAMTILLRFIPFLIFRDHSTPKFIEYLGKVLPFSIMAMLVVFCLKGTSFLEPPYGIPEIIACILVILLHIKFRNTLISIVSGTICYMVLIRLIF